LQLSARTGELKKGGGRTLPDEHLDAPHRGGRVLTTIQKKTVDNRCRQRRGEGVARRNKRVKFPKGGANGWLAVGKKDLQ